MTCSTRCNETFEELDQRESGGIVVSLLWNRAANSLSVVVVDEKTEEMFELPVQASEATEVFQHPYAYADRRCRGKKSLPGTPCERVGIE
jgi:hypothetical protein